MNSIIKNISKVLALTTMVSSFAISPGAKVSGVNQNNSRILTTREIAGDLNRMRRLLGDDVLVIGPAFLTNTAMAHRILQQLNALFDSNRQFTGSYTAYLRETRQKLSIFSFDDMPQDTMAKLRGMTPFRTPNQTGAITVGATTMLFNCSAATAEAQTSGAFMSLKKYFTTPTPAAPIGIAL